MTVSRAAIIRNCVVITARRIAYFFAGPRLAYSLPGRNDNDGRRSGSVSTPEHGAQIA